MVLAKQLKEAALSVMTMNVVEASDPVPEPFISWSKLCSHSPFTPNGRVSIFSNKLISSDPVMWPNYKGQNVLSGKWRDFDYTVLAP